MSELEPKLYQDPDTGLWIVEHPDGTVVRSHKSPEEYGSYQSYNPRTDEVSDVDVITSWKDHGKPCQRNSFGIGGKGYDRS